MPDESESPELFKLPFKQKDAWEWAFRAAMLAAYFWSTGHFVSVDRYEKDAEKQDAQRAIVLEKLTAIQVTMSGVNAGLKTNDTRDHNYELLERRVLTLEQQRGGNGK